MSNYNPEEHKFSENFLPKIRRVIDRQDSTLVNSFVCLFNHHQRIAYLEKYLKKIIFGGDIVPNVAESESEYRRWKKFYKSFSSCQGESPTPPSCSSQNFE